MKVLDCLKTEATVTSLSFLSLGPFLKEQTDVVLGVLEKNVLLASLEPTFNVGLPAM
jgi:hypothetical protein